MVLSGGKDFSLQTFAVRAEWTPRSCLSDSEGSSWLTWGARWTERKHSGVPEAYILKSGATMLGGSIVADGWPLERFEALQIAGCVLDSGWLASTGCFQYQLNKDA